MIFVWLFVLKCCMSVESVTCATVASYGAHPVDEFGWLVIHVEYDTPTSGRGLSHQSRTMSNDPDAVTILLIVP